MVEEQSPSLEQNDPVASLQINNKPEETKTDSSH